MFIYHFNQMIRNKVLWIIFAIVVGIAFLSMPSCFSDRSSEGRSAGTLGKESISFDEYNAVAENLRRQGLDTGSAAAETQIWARIAALHTARDLGLAATHEEVVAQIRSIPTFQKDGQFDETIYRRVLEANRFSQDFFERTMANDLTISKLAALIHSGELVSELEIEDQVSARTDAITFQYAEISNQFAKADMKVEEADLKAYYEEHKADFALDDRVALVYGAIPVTNFIHAAVVDEVEVQDFYEGNSSRFSRQGTNGVESIPFAEVKDEIVNELALKEAGHIAVTNLQEFVNTAFTNDVETFTWRCKARGMTTGELPLFSMEDVHFPGIERDAIANLKETALGLEAASEDYHLGIAQGLNYVYVVNVTTNDPAHTQTFDEVRSQVEPLALAAARAKAFDASAAEVRAAVAAAMATNMAFEAACAAQGLNVSTSITFTAETASPTIVRNARVLLPAVGALAKGAVSEPIKVYSGALLAHVSDRVAAEPGAAATAREQVRSSLAGIGPGAAFAEWMIWNLERTGFSSKQVEFFTATADDSAYED